MDAYSQRRPQTTGCTPAPALSLHHSPSYLFLASSAASCGELGRFPQCVLQAKEPMAWWLEQSCQAHVGTETKPPVSSHKEDKGVASPVASFSSSAERTCVLHGSQCSRYPWAHVLEWEMVPKKAGWESSRFVIPDMLTLEVQADLYSSRNREPLDVLGEAIQVSEELKHQNLRCWQAQTSYKEADNGWHCLNLLISLRIGLSAVKRKVMFTLCCCKTCLNNIPILPKSLDCSSKWGGRIGSKFWGTETQDFLLPAVFRLWRMDCM